MSRIRKHVILATQQEVKAPEEGQKIVRALGTRGGNIVEVEYPGGKQTLCLLPAKFNKKLWVRRGGYLLIDESPEAEGDSKVTGTIAAILYDEHIKQLKKLPGVWPEEFSSDVASGSLAGDGVMQSTTTAGPQSDDEHEDEDDDDPLLQPNTNRKQITHYVSDSDEDEDS